MFAPEIHPRELPDLDMCDLLLIPIADKRVRVWFAVHDDARPLQLLDINVRLLEVRILLQHEDADVHCEELDIKDMRRRLGKR